MCGKTVRAVVARQPAATMVNCAVFGCNNHTKKKPVDQNAASVGFFFIPKASFAGAVSSLCLTVFFDEKPRRKELFIK